VYDLADTRRRLAVPGQQWRGLLQLLYAASVLDKSRLGRLDWRAGGPGASIHRAECLSVAAYLMSVLPCVPEAASVDVPRDGPQIEDVTDGTIFGGRVSAGFVRQPKAATLPRDLLEQLADFMSTAHGIGAIEEAFLPANARSALVVRHVRRADRNAWIGLRQALWPDSLAGHAAEADLFFDGESSNPLAVLVAEDPGQSVVGFAEVSIRSYAEGCATDRVGFLEGWYVAPVARQRGTGRALVAAAEDWARSQGCTEFASDAEADNEESALAHRALGFEDVGLVRCFRKDL
jgi:aminoglycoside 6'-N-acetyltransferase I